MKSIKRIQINNIKITFQYLSQYITINSEIYKTLREEKIKAINKMIGVPKEVNCIYLGNNLTKDENKKIGDLFNHKEKVLIKLELPSIDSQRNSKEIIKRKKNSRSYNEMTDIRNNKSKNDNNNFNINSFLSNNNTLLASNKSSFSQKLGPINIDFKNNKKLKIKDKNPIYKKFINLISSKSPMSQREHLYSRNIRLENSLPPLKVKDDKLQNTNYKKFEKLCSCKKYPISEYCRKCGKFICNECRISEKHKGHLSIHLDMFNFKQNIFSYGKILQNDISNTLDLNKNIRYNSVDETNYKIEKEQIDEKFDKAIDKYFETINIINNYISKQDKEKTKLKIDAYNKSSLNIQKEITDLMIKFKNNKDKEMNLNYLEYFFREINSREETLLYLQKDILKYHILNEINIKMKSSLNKIEKILNEISNKKNPFNLDNKYHDEFVNMKIIKSDLEVKIEKKKEIEKEIKKKNIVIGGQIIDKEILMKRRSNIFLPNKGTK